MTERRIYYVEGPSRARLVDAYSQAQAVSHCAKSEYVAKVAGQYLLLAAIKAGITVETAGVIDSQFREVGELETEPEKDE